MPRVDFQVLGTPRSCQVLHEPDCIVHWPRPSVFHQPGQWGNILFVPRVFTHLKFNDMMDGCFWMGTLLCSWWYSQLIIFVSLMWPSIHPGFLMRLERSKSGLHLHQGWRVRAFMFYGFPRPIRDDRTTEAETENLSMGRFPATQRLHQPPLSPVWGPHLLPFIGTNSSFTCSITRPTTSVTTFWKPNQGPINTKRQNPVLAYT